MVRRVSTEAAFCYVVASITSCKRVGDEGTAGGRNTRWRLVGHVAMQSWRPWTNLRITTGKKSAFSRMLQQAEFYAQDGDSPRKRPMLKNARRQLGKVRLLSAVLTSLIRPQWLGTRVGYNAMVYQPAAFLEAEPAT